MTRFSDLALDPRVLQAVSEAGYETPTPIQAQAIPPALLGQDVLGIAQTGTGKTAGFVLPMITLLGQGRARARMPRSLVLAPTRELAAQVAENFETYAKHTKLTKALLIGGVSFGEQDKLIDRGVDVLIATPGRLLDHFERGKLLLNGVQIMVVDEADRMLDMGFIPDIERIFQLTPFTRQTLFFSATMAPEIERITNTFLTNPAKVEIARQATASTTIAQTLIQFAPTRKDRSFAEKRAVLRHIISAEGEACTNAIIFCNRKMDVDVVAKSLIAHGFNAAPIHGDLDQSQRTKTLDEFREGTLHLLVASDVAARGLDIPAVSHVFNFDVPSHPEDYVHRIGRTGRAGRTGKAYTIAVTMDDKYINAIESLVKMPIPRAPLPEGLDLASVSDTKRPDRGSDRASARGSARGSDRARGEDRSARGPRPEQAERGERPARIRAERAPRAATEVAPVIELQDDVAIEAVAAVATLTEAPRRERGPRREEPRRDDQRREEPRRDEPRRDDRRDRREDRQSGPQVVGMGEHVPDFILRSFKITSVTPDDAEAETTGTEG